MTIRLPFISPLLQDVAGAAAANQKFENLYDLTPRRRKTKLNLLRGEEQQAGELFEKIEHHRLLRRAREFALKALEAERHGLRLEADAQVGLLPLISLICYHQSRLTLKLPLSLTLTIVTYLSHLQLDSPYSHLTFTLNDHNTLLTHPLNDKTPSQPPLFNDNTPFHDPP